jgi:hypothetical protein
MSNGGILYDDIFKDASLIEASDEDSNYPVTNLLNGVPGESFKIDDTASTDSTLIEITLPETKAAQAIFLGAHNLNDGDIIKLYGYTEGNQFVTPAYTLDLEPQWLDRTVYAKQAGSLVQLTVADLNGGFRNLWKNFGETKSYKYWGIELVSDHQIIVGVIYAGLSFQFTKNYNVPFEESFEIGGTFDEINGQQYEDQSYERKAYRLPFTNAPYSDYSTLEQLQRQGYCVLVPDYAEKEAYHGVILKNGLRLIRKRGGQKVDYSLTHMENALT